MKYSYVSVKIWIITKTLDPFNPGILEPFVLSKLEKNLNIL